LLSKESKRDAAFGGATPFVMISRFSSLRP
jgi:hypothetical protein